jgi:5-methylcytosine-specific restriction enzyme subunit McrC
MPVTFEFGNTFTVAGHRLSLESYLAEVWSQNKPVEEEEPLLTEDLVASKLIQGFLTFDGEKARARNYIGFVQTDDFHLEIYPKVFKNTERNSSNNRLILKHIFFWFDYCRKWKFPFTDVNLENHDCDNLPELIINLMVNQILSIIRAVPLLQYEALQETLSVPRGRINFSRYISNGLSNGNQHQLECDYEPLVYDNQFNRIIKYVARQLKHKTRFPETNHKIDEILFILDEVSDETCSSASLTKIKLNRFFEEYYSLVNICKMVLDQEIYSHNFRDQSHWSLLFPMEYIFEDFVAGFIEAELADQWEVEFQKSDMYLTDHPNQAFQMQHDILLTAKTGPKIKVLLDTKYKLRPASTEEDKKQGIAQSDMYQMTAYGLRRGCSHIILLYPNYLESCRLSSTFVVSSGFDSNHRIMITAAEIPFWSISDFNGLKSNLINTLRTILKNT